MVAIMEKYSAIWETAESCTYFFFFYETTSLATSFVLPLYSKFQVVCLIVIMDYPLRSTQNYLGYFCFQLRSVFNY